MLDTAAERPTQALRVLVVDDNQDQCVLLTNLLRRRGYGVKAAHTGMDCLQTAAEWRPEVVLLDIGLPEIDGFEVARRLRADPVHLSIRLVALTGYVDDHEKSREAGFDAHLLKPYDFADVEKLLKSFV